MLRTPKLTVLMLGLWVATPMVDTATAAPSYAPLDCRKATSRAEQAICRNYALGQAEARMATLYGVATALVAMGRRAEIGDAQRKWLVDRERCGADTSCLTRIYDVRINSLSTVVDSITARGPF